MIRVSRKKSPVLQAYRPVDYLLIIQQDFGHTHIRSPDFNFLFTCPGNQERFSWLSLALQQAEIEIGLRLKKLSDHRLPYPVPWRVTAHLGPKPRERVGMKEACAILECSPSTVRRLVQDGALTCEITRKGHRRFRVEDLRRQKTPAPG